MAWGRVGELHPGRGSEGGLQDKMGSPQVAEGTSPRLAEATPGARDAVACLVTGAPEGPEGTPDGRLT